MEDESCINKNTAIRFDKQSMRLFTQDGEVKLDKKISLLLEFFLEHQDKVVTRQQLIERVWQNNYVSNDAINRAVSVLRKALGGDKDTYISTIPKVGYRFSIPGNPVSSDSKKQMLSDDSKLQPVALSLNPVSLQADEVCHKSRDVVRKTLRIKFWRNSALVGTFILIVSLIATLYPFSSTFKEHYEKSTQHIAVLPFRNLSNDPSHDIFVAGLSDEVVNNLARLNGAIILTPGTGYLLDNSTPDFKRLSLDTDAEYVLHGSVRYANTQIRIAVQLTHVESGVLVFSNMFERELADYFNVQKELSQQIRAALNLSLNQDINLYTKASERLDFLAIEQLVIARAKIMEMTEKGIHEALSLLKQLDQRYPQTPEIMGLQAYASFQLNSSTNVDIDAYLDDNIELAEQTLALDSSNLDALYTLANIYIGFPDWRYRGFELLKRLVRLHPGKRSVYMAYLYNVGILHPNCQALTNFVEQIPQRIFSSRQLSALYFLIEPCGVANLDLPQYERADVGDEILSFTYSLYLSGDSLYRAVERQVEETPNPRFLAELYDYQLFAGAYQTARQTRARVDTSTQGVWNFTMDTVGYLNEQTSSRRPSDYLAFVKQNYRNATLPGFSAALIKQALQEQRPELLTTYLSQVPEFPISIQNRGEAMGLSFLQRFAGNETASQQTAKRLYDQLERIWENDSASYDFWNMAPISFLAAVYQDDLTAAEQILETRFTEGYQYWFIEYESSKVVLSPWKETPVVREYLSRIQSDRRRMRETFALH